MAAGTHHVDGVADFNRQLELLQVLRLHGVPHLLLHAPYLRHADATVLLEARMLRHLRRSSVRRAGSGRARRNGARGARLPLKEAARASDDDGTQAGASERGGAARQSSGAHRCRDENVGLPARGHGNLLGEYHCGRAVGAPDDVVAARHHALHRHQPRLLHAANRLPSTADTQPKADAYNKKPAASHRLFALDPSRALAAAAAAAAVLDPS
jgi:hypothetical protein